MPKCPKCKKELYNTFECNNCGYDCEYDCPDGLPVDLQDEEENEPHEPEESG